MRQRRESSGVRRLIVSFVILLLALGIFMFRQQIVDYVVVATNKPSQRVVELAERSSMSDRGEFLYYASRPELLSREAFNSACHSVATEKTAVLGCYAGGQIFVFDIDNQKLAGIREVTAAHEMLHAAYVRLTSAERSKVDALLEEQLKNLGKDEQRITTLMAEYAKSEPGEKYNELHSILGTELTQLKPELERYYETYFTDRRAVVVMADAYQSVFDDLQNQQEALVSDMNRLADDIDARSSTYRAEATALGRDVDSFNQRATSGSMTRAQYDDERAELMARKNALNESYQRIQEIISLYNKKRNELAAINTESQALNRSINSSLKPVTEEL